jgi:acetyltransferase-like isoleucine patch superfamily enzyme
VGNYTYGGLYVRDFYYENERLEIGHFCSIASGVKFFLAGNHFVERPTTFPVKGFITGQRGGDGYSKGPIIVGSDVWFGYDAWIFSGLTIGQGAVIGARSLIVKDVPPYAIVGGNPARIIRYRFPEEIINELLKIDYSMLTKEYCLKYMDVLTRPLDVSRLRDLVHQISISRAED